MYAGQQSGIGYANPITPAALSTVNEIPSLLDRVGQSASELEAALTSLVDRLRPVMRQDKNETMPAPAPRTVANTQVGGRLDDVDRQLSFLRDSVSTVLSRLEV